MEDSEKKPEVPQDSEQKKHAASEELILYPSGPIKKLRGAGGKFVRGKRPMPETREVTALMRNLLLQPIPNEDGTTDKKAKTRFRAMWDNLIDIATADCKVPVMDKEGNIVWSREPKMAMASVKAFEVIMNRAHGMPSKNDEEIEAMKTAGVKMVVIQAPDLGRPIEEKPKEKLKPSWIEAEIVENKVQEES